ncbi:mitogen-activated protein kinase 3 [Tanacetum coccineum]
MELMNRKPLFPGKDHVHQMQLLTKLLGTPTVADLGFIKNKDAMTYLSHLPRHPHKALLKTFPHVNQSAIELVEKMLMFDPDKRITGVVKGGHVAALSVTGCPTVGLTECVQTW